MITPEQLAASGSEHGHQVAFFQWAATISDIPDLHLLYAVPNGGERNLKVASNMKAEGVKSGVPDVVWPVPKGYFASLYLELKRPAVVGHKLGGRSDAQERWHKALVGKAHAVVTCYGWKAMARAVEVYAKHPQMLQGLWVQRSERNGSLFVAERGKGTIRLNGVNEFFMIGEEIVAW